mgnify:CR=1 FL=1
MNSSAPLWVCDSCTLIDILTGDKRYANALAPVKRARAEKHIILGVSEITVAECCRLTLDSASKRCPTVVVEEYLADENSRRFPVTASVSARANALIRLFRLETCDAIIVATALLHKASKLITRDNSTICKRIRKNQNLPGSVSESKGTAKPIYDDSVDESGVLEELQALEILQLKESVFIAPELVRGKA